MRSILYLILFSFAFTGFAQNTGARIIDSLEAELKTKHADTVTILVLNKLCWEYRISDYKKAIDYGNQALYLSKKIKHTRGEAAAYSCLGVIYEKQGDYELAREQHFKALSINEAVKDKKSVAKVYTNIGITYQKQGEYVTSVDYHIKSLKIKEELKDSIGMSNSYLNIANIYLNQEKYTTALENYFKSLGLRKDRGEDNSVAYLYNGIGVTYQKLDKYKEAVEFHFKSLRIKEKAGDLVGIGHSHNNLGVAYIALELLDSARVHAVKALSFFEKTGHKEGMSVAAHNMANILRLSGKFMASISEDEKSLAIAMEIGDKERQKEAYLGMSKAYDTLHQTAKAFSYFKLYTAVKDSLLNSETGKQIEEMAAKYETEKKDKELLRKDLQISRSKAELEQQEARVKRARLIFSGGIIIICISAVSVFLYIRQKRTKEKMIMLKQMAELEHQALRLQMNPHFIFNSLSSINNFIGNNETAEAKRYLSKFAKLMRLILENSRESYVMLEKEIDSLRYYMELEQLRFNNKFSFEINTEENIDPANAMIPPMLIQPHIENAILHGIAAKTSDGKIQVTFSKKNDSLRCVVTDNGVGRKKSSELKQELGLSHKSLAMTVTKERLEILHGNGNKEEVFVVEDLEDTGGGAMGTKISFGIPMKLHI